MSISPREENPDKTGPPNEWAKFELAHEAKQMSGVLETLVTNYGPFTMSAVRKAARKAHLQGCDEDDLLQNTWIRSAAWIDNSLVEAPDQLKQYPAKVLIRRTIRCVILDWIRARRRTAETESKAAKSEPDYSTNGFFSSDEGYFFNLHQEHDEFLPKIKAKYQLNGDQILVLEQYLDLLRKDAAIHQKNFRQPLADRLTDATGVKWDAERVGTMLKAIRKRCRDER